MAKPTFNHILPSTTVNQSRIGLFQPTRRPKFLKNYLLETPWGCVRVTGRLGQKHSDVFEALLYCAEAVSDLEDGRFKVLVDLYQVKKHANVKSSKELTLIIRELFLAYIEVDFPSKHGGRCESAGHIIDYRCHAETIDGMKITRINPINKEQRPLWAFEAGKALCDIIDNDCWITDDPMPIAKMNIGICQSIAKFVRSHKNQPRGGWILLTLIKNLGGNRLTKQQIYDRTREVNENRDLLLEYGIEVLDGRVQSKKVEQ